MMTNIDSNINNNYFELFDHIPSGILILDKDYNIIFWNSSLEYWTGISKKNIEQHPLFEFFPNINQNKYKARIDGIFEGDPPTIFSSLLHKYFIPITLPNGELQIQHTNVRAIPNPNDDKYLALIVIEDVTELTGRIREHKRMRDLALEEVDNRKKAEEALQQSEKQLRDLNATKDRFFSIIAHDLKNPIGAFINISEILTTMFTDLSTAEVKDLIGEMYKSARKLFSLLENLLIWARTQTGRLECFPDIVTLNYIVENLVSTLSLTAENKKIKLQIEMEEGVLAWGDDNMVSTVIRNLISNAIKFTPENGIITVSTQYVDDDVLVSVTDTGVGISEEDIKKLFRIDVHHTTIGTGSEKGTGLGLILCKEFVEQNHGTIWVESKIGEGSSFKFTIPRNKPV